MSGLYVVCEESGDVAHVRTLINGRAIELPAIVISEEEAREVLWAAHSQGKRPMTIERVGALAFEPMEEADAAEA